MTIPKFDEKELKPIGEIPGFFGPGTPIFDSPVSMKENFKKAVLEKKPVFQLYGCEMQMTTPLVIPDSGCRALAIEARKQDPATFGGKDMFDTDWVYVQVAGGSMVEPGKPRLEDANDWKDEIKMPDVDSWDWEGWWEANKEWIDPARCYQPCIFTGWYERLISFMDFEGAAVALIDDEQKEAVLELYDAITDVYIKIMENFLKYVNVEAVCVHDDWGSQRAPFFSCDTAIEMMIPAMKKFTDFCHEKGMICEIHSCGMNEMLVPAYIAGGWDMWSPQPMNDTKKLFELYGDKIVIGVNDIPVVAPDATEEEQRAAAKEFVETYCIPGKVCTLGFGMNVTPIMREEIYKLSRIAYAE